MTARSLAGAVTLALIIVFFAGVPAAWAEPAVGAAAAAPADSAGGPEAPVTAPAPPVPPQLRNEAPPPGRGLTLNDAVEHALSFFPTVRSARAEVRGAEADAAAARGAWLPDLSLRGSASRYQKPTFVYPIHSFSPGSFPPFNRTVFQGGAYLDYTLFDGGGRVNRVRRANRATEASRAALTGSESEIIAQVTAKYLEILSRREALDAHDRRLEALRSERGRVLQFERAGRAARVESLRVEAALSAAEAERVRLAGDLAQSERDLTGLTGIPRDRTRARNLTGLALADTVLAPGDTLVARAFRSSPDVREAERNAAAARAAAGAVKASRLPNLELTGGYQVWSDPDGNSSNEWNAAVRVTQPLFTGGELSGRIRKAEAGRTRAAEGLRLARITTRRAVLEAADRVRQAEARTASLRAAADRYDEVARIEALALRAGTGTQTDFLGAEADLLNARASLAEARRAEITARVELARLTGALNLDWLNDNLETER
jgi:outer membrane protein TolC